MKNSSMTSLERVLTTLGHKEPDRVPLFLLLTMHGAKETGLTIKEYFSDPKNVIEGQLRLRKKYQNDCYTGFLYASLETEAFGGETIFIEDGPPNAAEPVINKFEDILNIEPPEIKDCPGLQKVLAIQAGLKAEVGNDAPIIGVVMSPFSLPVMQMGFENYLLLMFEHQDLFERLMKINEIFCVEWANAQLDAGATAICYFDPISSTTIVSPEQYRKTGLKVAQRTIQKIKGPTATHFASGNCLPIINDIKETGTAIIGVSSKEDLRSLKSAADKQLTLLGNLDGIKMRRWTVEEAETAVKKTIAAGGKGGGFILSDNHGEIPYQVPDETLIAISEAVRKWGEYPLKSGILNGG
ncbi:MAG: uroporphyrinogen decarboxylase family protein [Anaerolineaceae bacterium]|nr:uroporphyrinogen decarboxylase family protein [Anaerolineaceae bacterium]